MKPITRMVLAFTAFLAFWAAGSARAQLNIQITGGTEAAQPIAVVPFGVTEGLTPQVQVASVIGADLGRTGQFRPMPAADMLAQPSTDAEVDLRDWRTLGMNNLLIGRIEPDRIGYRLDFTLYDVFRGTKLVDANLTSSKAGLRNAAHRISDIIYEKLTGQRGVAATHIAYVTSTGQGRQQTVTLRVADADGYNPQTIVSSHEPIMSPAWAPDGQAIAYVSFERNRSAVYVQNLATGRREIIANYQGLNSAPAFSPDGRRLALTLSKDGNPEIYVYNFASRTLTRLTSNLAIDTEPAWAPDGEHLIFTSNRGGSPQIYRMSVNGGSAERVSFQGDYNASGCYSPDGRSIALVTRINGQFRIGLLDLSNGSTRVLSSGNLDDSPSFAPNGSMVLYATLDGGREILAATSVHGGANQRLSTDAGEVRDPAWSPFAQ